ncbi:hypothetical protein KAX97_14400 [candidate division WOR-3 bacterium]|nr:hypothetical protein [candidate division WOR-3 bacterium]
MEEAIEIMALKGCYKMLGAFSVNQLVMFLMVIILFGIIVWLVMFITKLQAKVRELQYDRGTLILRLSKKEKVMKDEVRREAEGDRKKRGKAP